MFLIRSLWRRAWVGLVRRIKGSQGLTARGVNLIGPINSRNSDVRFVCSFQKVQVIKARRSILNFHHFVNAIKFIKWLLYCFYTITVETACLKERKLSCFRDQVAYSQQIRYDDNKNHYHRS